MRQFRLYPQPRRSRLYVEVRLYRSRRRMIAALERFDRFLNVTADWSDTLGVCRGTWIVRSMNGSPWRRTPEVARVFLMSHCLGAGLVAHELAHAACMWARRVRLDSHAVIGSERGRRRTRRAAPTRSENSDNERFADVMGHLNAQFWRAYYSRRRTAR